MIILRIFLHISFLIFALSVQLFAQQNVPNYPIGVTQYNQQLSFQNPAATAMHNKWETSITAKRNTGFWRNNQTYLAYGGFRINPKKSKSFQSMGATFYSDKEGIYLHRYRAYLLYAYHVALNSNWTLSTGLSFGMMTYQVGSNDYDGGSSSNWDGSLGVMLYNKSFYGGIAVAQLPDNKVQPIQEITVLSRYLQCTMGKEFEMGETYSLKSSLNGRIFSQKNQAELYLQTGIVWNKLLGLYGIYKWNKQASVMLGLEKLEFGGMQFRSYFSYDVPINGDSRYRAFEITLQYLMPEMEKLKTKKSRKKK